MPKCVVCDTPNVSEQRGSHGTEAFARYDCPRCGVFVLTDVAENALELHFAELPLRRSLMSFTLRRMQTPDRATRNRLINYADLPSFWSEGRLPNPLQQADNLILWIGDNQTAPAVWAETIRATLRAEAKQTDD